MKASTGSKCLGFMISKSLGPKSSSYNLAVNTIVFHATALNSLPGNTTDSKSDIRRLGQFSEFRGLCEDLIQYTQCISHSASKNTCWNKTF